MSPAEATLPAGLEALAAAVAERLAPAAHGDMPRWLAALDALPPLVATQSSLAARVSVDGAIDDDARARLERALLALRPWRKGPFSLFGVHIDSEWRSDWKWQRVAPHVTSLAGRRVLDVGCGNGYFGWRMLEAGAAEVVGVDPSPLFCLQHRAVNGYLVSPVNHVLPVRFEEMPAATFDCVFSMGVIYHRRDPQEHTRRLFRHTRPGGQVVLESLVVDGPRPLTPRGRYARMRNVWQIPTTEAMQAWLQRAGFVDVVLADRTATAPTEQRSTRWMPFESLAQALDTARPCLTVEGLPAPVRAVVTARKTV